MNPPRNLTRNNINRLDPYIPGYQPENPESVLKLNANENPYPPSPKVLEALHGNISDVLRLYPNSRSTSLRRQLARVYEVDETQVFAANGSDEIISLVFRTFVDENDLIMSPYPTYTFYQTAAEIHGARYQSIDTDQDFRVNLNQFLNSPAKIVFLANPNAQTGLLLPPRDIEAFLADFNGLLVVDEAYIDFCSHPSSVYRLSTRYDNLIVMRTFSKSYSLCGIRVGFAFGHPSLIESLDKTKDSYNIAYLNQVAAIAALEDVAYMEANARRIKTSREAFQQTLSEMGFFYLPSDGNFVLLRHPRLPSRMVYDSLKEENILVRYFEQPRLQDYVRISIGTDPQLVRVLAALRAMVAGLSNKA